MFFSIFVGLLCLGKLCLSSDLDNVVIEKLQDIESRLVRQENIIKHQQQVINRLEEKCGSKNDKDESIRCANCDQAKSSNISRTQLNTQHTQHSITARQIPERIAFTAYLDHQLTHLGIDQPIAYNKVLLNEGSAYHPSTGMFTTPLDGLYVFYFSVSTYRIHQAAVQLVVEGVKKVDAIADTFHDYHNAQGANFAVLSLKQGEQVWVANYIYANQYIDSSDGLRFSTFSGYMLN